MEEFEKLREFPIDESTTNLSKAIGFTDEEVEIAAAKMSFIMNKFLDGGGESLATAAKDIGEILTIKELVLNSVLHFKAATEQFIIEKMKEDFSELLGKNWEETDNDSDIDESLD